MSYLGNSPLNRLFSDVTRIATQGQAAFQFSYTPGVAIVSRNGVILDADELTATDGSLITLATAANAGDSIRCIALNQFNVADALPLSGGSMGGPLTLAGNSVDPMNPVALAEFIGTNQSKAGNGYQKLPGGLIIQWGQVTGSAGGTTAATFPIAFPNASRQVLTAPIAAGDARITTYYGLSKTGFNFDMWNRSSPRSGNWLVFGNRQLNGGETMFYSKSTNGFYDAAIHGDNIPADAAGLHWPA